MKLFPLTLSATALLLSTAFADPLPTNPSVAAGSASFSSGANSLVVTQSTSNAIINWNTFSVASGNTVQFVQPSASSAVLNRVTSTDPSHIYGQVSANGQFFLVNPNGILVGSGGRIDANNIFLSTSNITDSNFLVGNIHFDALSGGTITLSGDVFASGSFYIRAPITFLGHNYSIFDYSGSGGVTLSSSLTMASGYPTVDYTSTQIFRSRQIEPISSDPISISASIGLASSGQIGEVPRVGLRLPAAVSIATGSLPAVPNGAVTVPSSPTTVTRNNTQPSPSIGGNVSGFTDGAVTVRLSLVDAAPILLR